MDQARSQTDEQSKAVVSYDVLKLSIKAKEQMTMEATETDIPERKNDLKIIVQDSDGKPVPGATVTYTQTNLDFVLTYGQGAPFGQFPYPSYRAGIDIGYQSLYGIIQWNQVSPQEGVFDFSSIDAAFNQWKEMGYEITAALAWLGSDNVPAWAENLSFPDFQQQVAEFVKRAVEHYSDSVKYMYVATEINLQTITGSRYVSVEYPSNYLTEMQPADLIQLIKTAFQAAREVNSDMLLGYYGITDYIYNSLNLLPFGAWPLSYTFLKDVLDSGVKPDFIGVETYPGSCSVPLDLSTVAAILQAYHDLSGLPVMIAETISYPSRAEDYGATGPTPNVYWHEKLTQAAQAEWDTSFEEIAMSLPYVLGVQMFHNFPDYYQPQLDPSMAVRLGSDTITTDFKPKQVYYAMQDLIASWKTNGSGVTNALGEVNLTGMDGTYSIKVTAANGLTQSFISHLSQSTNTVTITLDTHQAQMDLQHRLAKAEKAVDWSSQLGRLLDYGELHAQLSQARNALIGGDYAIAGSIIDQVLDETAIKIDGSASDWQGIPPLLTAPQGGVAVAAPGVDLKALFGVQDDTYLYLMLEVYDPPIMVQPDQIVTGLYYPQFLLNIIGDNTWIHMRTYLPYHGQINVYNLIDPAHFVGTYYSIAYDQVLELKLPLTLLDHPFPVSVNGFVFANNNGVEQVAKAFEGSAEVLHPNPSIYLPLVKR